VTPSSGRLRQLQGQVAIVGAGILGAAALAAALFFAVPAAGGSQGEGPHATEKREPAAPCGERHRGGGENAELDLAAVRRAYRGLAEGLGRSLDRSLGDLSQALRQPYDAGLPACRSDASRTEALEEGKAALYRGRLLYFAAASQWGRVELPREVEQDPRAEILLTRLTTLGDLPGIRERLGRPVSLASAAFAKSLGVRCVNTWIKISEKGDAIELHESR
jgi:hypothetical protein